MKIEAYTDGSAKNNGQKNAVGGWAYIIVENDQVSHHEYGFKNNTTNQAMELFAAWQACEYCLNKYNNPFNEYYIHSDSAYLVNCANQGWYNKWLGNDWLNTKGEPVANKELWKQLIPFFENYQFHFIKVKGHSDNSYNNKADQLAQNAAEFGRQNEDNNN